MTNRDSPNPQHSHRLCLGCASPLFLGFVGGVIIPDTDKLNQPNKTRGHVWKLFWTQGFLVLRRKHKQFVHQRPCDVSSGISPRLVSYHDFDPSHQLIWNACNSACFEHISGYEQNSISWPNTTGRPFLSMCQCLSWVVFRFWQCPILYSHFFSSWLSSSSWVISSIGNNCQMQLVYRMSKFRRKNLLCNLPRCVGIFLPSLARLSRRSWQLLTYWYKSLYGVYKVLLFHEDRLLCLWWKHRCNSHVLKIAPNDLDRQTIEQAWIVQGRLLQLLRVREPVRRVFSSICLFKNSRV